MKALRLFWIFFRVGVLGELAYPANFFLQLFESLLDLGTALGGLAGLGIAFGLTLLMSRFFPAALSLPVTALALFVSLLTGVVS